MISVFVLCDLYFTFENVYILRLTKSKSTVKTDCLLCA